jgi:predicted GNAT family N-acyltransferase
MGATGPTYSWVDGGAELDGALRVREQVFCREQGVPLAEEHDGRDGEAEHLVALAGDGRVVATLRVLVADGTAKIGRVAVERDWRRRGVASRMLELALARARERGCACAALAAQVDACELYRRVGFSVESEPFVEAGIEHVWMGRPLSGAGA